MMSRGPAAGPGRGPFFVFFFLRRLPAGCVPSRATQGGSEPAPGVVFVVAAVAAVRAAVRPAMRPAAVAVAAARELVRLGAVAGAAPRQPAATRWSLCVVCV
jgi:hypothetical protein